MLNLNCKNVQHVKIYPPCNFEVNSNIHFGVIVLFSSNFQNVDTFHPLFQKLLEMHVDVQFKLQTCSACEDLPHGVIALFSSIFFLILVLFVLYFKNY